MVARAPHKDSHLGRKPSDYNKAFQGTAFPWVIPRLDIDELDPVAEGDPLVPGVGTHTLTNPTVAGVFDASAAAGSRFTDDLADVIDAGTDDFLFFPVTEEDELDYFLFAFDNPVTAIELILGSANGAAGAIAVEYCKDGPNDIWTAFSKLASASGTFDLQGGTATVKLSWQLDDDWSPQVLSEVTNVLSEAPTARYYVRFRVTTVYSTNPDGSRLRGYEILASSVANMLIAPSTGLIDVAQWASATATGSANDTILEI
ncbi:hypothetical protein LCGC14_2535580, partial [marine sediment metagenome]